MGRLGSSRFSSIDRVEADPEVLTSTTTNGIGTKNIEPEIEDTKLQEPKPKKVIINMGNSLKAKVLSRVFSEDYDKAKNKILDPRGQTLHYWSKAFLAASIFSIFIDPFFLYVPIMREDHCIDYTSTLRTVITVIRSLGDVFYVVQIFIGFHTAYISPSSRVLGRGELVISSSKIALRYLQKGFWLDLVTALPLPQLSVWFIMPNVNGWGVFHRADVLWYLIIFQSIPRFSLVFPLSSLMVEASGIVTKTAMAAAGYNFLVFFLAGHVFGAAWYIMSIQRQEDCWHWVCNMETAYSCPEWFFDCRYVENQNRVNWFQSTNVTTKCNPTNKFYPFGIMGQAVQYTVQELPFIKKYFYCLWWGLQNMSTLGQSFFTSTYVGENVFSCIIIVVGLSLLAMLIGNVQRYLFSTTRRLEDWKIQRGGTEQWMHHRELPAGLRRSIRKYDEYKWLTGKGVDEESIIQRLPTDLKRKVKRHLCYDLLRRVPLIDEMDEPMLDAICERLKPVLCTKGMFLIREGDPVNRMLFIIRGQLDSYTTEGTHTRVLNLYKIGPGDFCGEELLTWLLDPRPRVKLPMSTRSVKAISEVEAFALTAEDVKFVASHFRRLLNGKQLKNKFRYYSHQWRTWAASAIQAAWRRYKCLKERPGGVREPGLPTPGSFWDVFAKALVSSTRCSPRPKMSDSSSETSSTLEKPDEPDFTQSEEFQ